MSLFGVSAPLPSNTPKPLGLDGQDFSSNEKAVALPWFTGAKWCPLKWITDIHNPVFEEVTQKTGKKSESVVAHDVFGDVAGVTSIGLADAILAIESQGTKVWEGRIERPSDSQDPDYYFTTITTDVGTCHFYWGRNDQPVDTKLLGPLGTTDSALEHPAYRGMPLAVWIKYYFGQASGDVPVPTTRVLLERTPKPTVGTFARQAHFQGESAVAAILEILTDPRFGLGMDASKFTASKWETIAGEVDTKIGRLSPFMERTRAANDLIREIMSYYDGWIRVENGKLVPGHFPHDGVVPSPITELSHHDFIDQQNLEMPGFPATINRAIVKYRNRDESLKKDTVTANNVRNRKARGGVGKSQEVDKLFFVDVRQAGEFANEFLSTGAEGENSGGGDVRRAKAVHPDTTPILEGDNFQLDDIDLTLDQVMRVVNRRIDFRGTLNLEFVNERGVFPLPYRPPDALQPVLGETFPQKVAQARVFEMPPELAGTPLGLPIAFLAKRPAAKYASPFAAITTKDVIGFRLWYSKDNTTYDLIGPQTTWAVRGVIRTALNSTDVDPTVQVTLDSDNLDIAKIQPQTDEEKDDDTLLLISGEEIFSVGNVSLNAFDYDLVTKRGRLGSAQESHAINDVVYLIFRSEIVRFTHKNFIESQLRYFKPQPYTGTNRLALTDATPPFQYTFIDRDPQRPVIAFQVIPSSSVVGEVKFIEGAITDVNGDLRNFIITANMMDGPDVESEITVQSGDIPKADQASFDFKTTFVFPLSGTWKIKVVATDAHEDGITTLLSADITVTVGGGSFGPADPTAPPALTGVVFTPGFETIWGEWDDVPVGGYLNIYENTVNVKPGTPVLRSYTNFFSRRVPGNNVTRYYWIEPVNRSGVVGTVSGSFAVTTTAGIGLPELLPNLQPIEIATSKPSTGNYDGRTIFLTTDKKLWRYDASVPEWTTKVDGADLISNSIVAGSIAAAAIVASHIGANEIIANIANIKDAIITSAKIASLSVTKLTSGDIESVTINLLSAGPAKIKSDNFLANVSGFQILGDGNAEFNDVNIRGDLDAGKIEISDVMYFHKDNPANTQDIQSWQTDEETVDRNCTDPGSISSINFVANDGTNPTPSVTFYGWASVDAAANAKNRFLRPEPIFYAAGVGEVEHHLSIWIRRGTSSTWDSWEYVTGANSAEAYTGVNFTGAAGVFVRGGNLGSSDRVQFALAPRLPDGTLRSGGDNTAVDANSELTVALTHSGTF